MNDPFAILGLAPTRELGAVKRAWFTALPKHPPESDPEGFRRLRDAYEKLSTPAGLTAAFASAPLDLEAVRAGRDFSAELVRIADELEDDPARLQALVAEIAAPLGTTLSGYQPGIEAAQALRAARDTALGLLLAQGGERS